jgi:hypothetical protein
MFLGAKYSYFHFNFLNLRCQSSDQIGLTLFSNFNHWIALDTVLNFISLKFTPILKINISLT